MAGKFTFNTRGLAAGIRRELLAQPERARRAMTAVGGYLAGEAKDRVDFYGMARLFSGYRLDNAVFQCYVNSMVGSTA